MKNKTFSEMLSLAATLVLFWYRKTKTFKIMDNSENILGLADIGKEHPTTII